EALADEREDFELARGELGEGAEIDGAHHLGAGADGLGPRRLGPDGAEDGEDAALGRAVPRGDGPDGDAHRAAVPEVADDAGLAGADDIAADVDAFGGGVVVGDVNQQLAREFARGAAAAV